MNSNSIDKISENLIKKSQKHDDKLTELFILTAKLQMQLGAQQDIMREYQLSMAAIHTNLVKINRHTAWVEGVIKFIGFAGILGGAIAAFTKMFGGVQ